MKVYVLITDGEYISVHRSLKKAKKQGMLYAEANNLKTYETRWAPWTEVGTWLLYIGAADIVIEEHTLDVGHLLNPTGDDLEY